MKYVALGAIAIAVIAVAFAGVWVYSDAKPVQVAPPQQTEAVTKPNPPTRTQLLALVNAERAKHGAVPLVESQLLDQSAQLKADDESTYDYYNHVSSVASPFAGMNGYKFIDRTGQQCVYESENIAENQTSDAVIAEWINSPEHHEAMIDSRYDLTGFGFSLMKDVPGSYNIVEHFCQTP